MNKKICSCILMLVLVLNFLPMAYAADKKDPYTGFSMALVDGSNSTTYTVSGGFLGYTNNNQQYRYENVDFGVEKPVSVELAVKASAVRVGSNLELRLDSATGPLVADLAVKAGETWGDVIVTGDVLCDISGVHTIYLLTKQCNLDYYTMKFNIAPDTSDFFETYSMKDAFSDIYDSKYRYFINYITSMGISLAYDAGDLLYPDHYITRGQFAYLLGQLAGRSTQTEQISFSDVAEDYVYCESIHNVAAAGLMRGREEGKFYPYEYISLTEAAASVSRLLDYEIIAQKKGGYPGGYQYVAKMTDLFNGLSGVTYLTNGSVARFLKNVITAPYYDVEKINSDGMITYDIVTKGIFYKTKGLCYGKGLLKGNNFSLVNLPDSVLSEDKVLIDDTVFSVGESKANELLGYECEYFYTEDGDMKTITNIFVAERVNLTELDSRYHDVTEINASEISYTDKESGENKKIKLEQCHFIYNNVSLNVPLKSAVTYPFKGNITVIDNPGVCDTVLIKEYVNVKIDGYDEYTGKIIDLISGESYDVKDAHFFLNVDGVSQKASYENIKNGDVGRIYESKNTSGKKVIQLFISNEMVEGVVSELDNDDETITIDSEEYKVDNKTIESLGLSPVRVGFRANFLLNGHGEIISYEFVGEDNIKLGFLITSGEQRHSGISEKPAVKLITKENEIKTYEFAESCKVDGVYHRKGEGILASISTAKNAPVRYRLDEDGKISMLDTVEEAQGKQRGSDPDDMIIKVTSHASNSQLVWQTNWSAFMDKDDSYTMRMMSDKDIVVFTTYGDDETDWGFYPMNTMTSAAFYGDGYSYNAEEKMLNVFVTPKAISSTGDLVLAYDKKMHCLDEDGNEWCYKIIAHRDGTEVSYLVKKDAIKNQLEVLKKGDLILVSDTDGEIEVPISVIAYADGSKSRLYSGGEMPAKVYYDDEEALGATGIATDDWGYFFGSVVRKIDDFVEIKFANANKSEPDYTYFKVNNPSTRITKYIKADDIMVTGRKGTDVQVGDMVCMVMKSKIIKGVHVIADAALAAKIK